MQLSQTEKQLLKGQSSKLAAKHKCSKEYVLMLINGKREVSSALSIKIYRDINELLEILKPVE
ncbi:hypothetical protein KORDIASMS9_02706 [Kordia sp. SMS9]|nr:hypothetical protein KORDIASMS9_02706 [Kordia sp. SMS9]